MQTIDIQFIMCLILAAVVVAICRAFYVLGYQAATNDMIYRQIEADFEHDQELNQRLSERIENAIKQANHDRK